MFSGDISFFLSSQYIFIFPIVFIFGLILGSFLNVVIYRLPRKESIVFPPSHCTHCNTLIHPWDNIPVLSYLILRGKCRNCGEKIDLRYPIVELIMGFSVLALTIRFGFHLSLFSYIAFVFVLIAASYIDIDVQLIPDTLTLTMIIIGFIGAGLNSLFPSINFWPISFLHSLIGGGVGFSILLLFLYGYMLITNREGMGGGDLKLLAMIGVYLGWEKTLLTLFLASLIGSIISVPLMLFQGKNRHATVTFGPFLSLGALASLFYGDFLINSYFELLKHGTQ